MSVDKNIANSDRTHFYYIAVLTNGEVYRFYGRCNKVIYPTDGKNCFTLVESFENGSYQTLAIIPTEQIRIIKLARR